MNTTDFEFDSLCKLISGLRLKLDYAMEVLQDIRVEDAGGYLGKKAGTALEEISKGYEDDNGGTLEKGRKVNH